MDDLIGRVIGLGGRYRLLAVIAQGGMGTVFQAEQLNVPRQVAVKVADPVMAAQPIFVQRFHQEIGAIARLEHGRHILPVYDVGNEDGLLYMVMPLVTGGTLKDRLVKGGGQPWAPRQALPLAEQVLDALGFAHERGFIHRDVKPSNILLEGDWVYLADFGIAKVLQEASDLAPIGPTLTGAALMGTPTYMAPEQALGLPIDTRADLYAFGVVLYEVLTGRVPYQAKTPMQMAFKHVEAALPPPRQVNPGLAPVVEAVLLKALARQPEQRFATAQAFGEALAQAVEVAEPAPPRRLLHSAVVVDGAPAAVAPPAIPAGEDGAAQETGVAGRSPSQGTGGEAGGGPDTEQRQEQARWFEAELFRRLERVKSKQALRDQQLRAPGQVIAEQAVREARERAAREQAAREAQERRDREEAARAQAAREAEERQARERAAREQAAREQAAREQAARELAAREQAAREQAAREQAAREMAAQQERERIAREAAAQQERERQAREAADRERIAREVAAREQAAREAAAQQERERAARELAALNRAAEEQATRERRERERQEQERQQRAAQEQAAREQAAREQAAREWAAKEQAAREQAARETAARESAAREQAAREQAARDLAAREQAAREAAQRERVARERAVPPGPGVVPALAGGKAEAGEVPQPHPAPWIWRGVAAVITLTAVAALVIAAGPSLGLRWPAQPAAVRTVTPATVPAGTSPAPSTAPAPLSHARVSHSATLLNNGKVLVAGGQESNTSFLASAELYDPATNAWTSAGQMSRARAGHTATLLDNGQVLVAGGQDTPSTYLASSELYDPATNRWTPVEPLSSARAGHTATLLKDGRVLVVGGKNDALYHATAEAYDPATKRWLPAGRLDGVRTDHVAQLLSTGQVVVIGGTGGDNATTYLTTTELYDPATNRWTSGAALAIGRSSFTATLLKDGQTLVAGGFYTTARAGAIVPVLPAEAERYDPSTYRWETAGALAQGRVAHTTTLLPNGKVLAVGGETESNGVSYLAASELYDPSTKGWAAGAPLEHARAGHTATLLTSGQVLVAGGQDSTGPLASVERYDPATNTWITAH